MRAVLLENIEVIDKKINLDKDQVHHFYNVLRLKVGSQVLILNGKGLKIMSCVSLINKREVTLDIIDRLEEQRDEKTLDLAMGIVKKDALESSLRSCVELGVKNIYFMQTQFSQVNEIKHERIRNILITACEQSNNPFLPSYSFHDFAEILNMDYERYFWGKMEASSGTNCGKCKKILALVGPEGGFSKEEEKSLEMKENSIGINLGSNILRTRTAIPAMLGYIKAIENLDA